MQKAPRHHRRHGSISMILLALLILCSINTAHAVWPPSGWAYWLQNTSISTLVSEQPDIVVMDYSSTGGADGEWTAQQISDLKAAGITPIAYFSIGEAEDYRFYWDSNWSTTPPAWLGPENPDWAGNFKVRFWMDDWKAILYGTPDGDQKSYLDRILAQGFEGIYLDIVDAYYYWSEEASGEDQFAAAPDSMVALLAHLNEYAISKGKSNFIVIPQNGEWLQWDCSDDSRSLYYQTIDAIGIEDLYHPGDLDEDNPYSPRDKGPINDLLDEGKVVLTVEYLTQQNLIDNYLSAADTDSYLALATVRALDEYHYYGTATTAPERVTGIPMSPLLTAYPNPFNGHVSVQVESAGAGKHEVQLFNLLGERVLSRQQQSAQPGTMRFSLDLNGLPSGTYLLKVGEASQRITLLR